MLLVNRLKKVICSLVLSPIFLMPLIKLFRICAITGQGSNLCLKNGFLPLPVHFHSPVPDIKDLGQRKIWDVRSELRGIDFRAEAQVELLNELGLYYSNECQWPLMPTNNPSEFYLQNPSFSYGCAASTHCMIRHFRPNTVIEIGSGMSSMVISNALAMTCHEDGHNRKYIIVDPYPTDFIKGGSIEMGELLKIRVELLDTTFFDQLKANDVLFIDSGHCVRIGGDVNYLFLDILPRLEAGVIVHIHDISMPYEYSKVYATNETFRQFWTEQYLLQSFLCFNNKFEVLLATHYLMTDCFEMFRKWFPHYNAEIHPFTSGSFWMRRKLGNEGTVY